MIEERFGESPPFSVGVEEEVMILDAATLAPAPAVELLLAETSALDLPGTLATELHATVVELKTGPCVSASEALGQLRELRAAVGAAAARNGLRLAAAGTHPIAIAEDVPTVDNERYRAFVDYAGVSARRQAVSGLHVHVGMPDADACFRALEGVLPWLPVVLALSANSPYYGGRETGLASNRAEVLAQLPRSGAPPAFGSYAGWLTFVERFRTSGIELASDYTTFWWDVRPHPRFGTLEVRMPDQPTAVERTGAFAALVQSLAATVLEFPGETPPALARGYYAQNRWAAARFGPRARLLHPTGEGSATVSELTAELLRLVEPAAAELGASSLLADLDPGESEGDRQLEIGRASGLEAVCAHLADRF